MPLPSVLVPSLHLSLRQRQRVGDVAAIRHAKVLLATEFPLEISQLSVRERGASSSRFPAGRRYAATAAATAAGHAAVLLRRGRRAGRRRERRWRAAQTRTRTTAGIDGVLRARVNGRVVLRVFCNTENFQVCMRGKREEGWGTVTSDT